MSRTSKRPVLSVFLGALCLAVIVVAYTSVGAASSPTAASRRVITAADGVVQSTVSGSGTLQPATKVGVNFATGGTLTRVVVSPGERVEAGELLAEIDPASAESNLRSAELTLSTDEASYQDALKGLTPAEQHQTEISAEQARAAVRSARQSLQQDQQTASAEASSAAATVAQDEQALKSTQQSVTVEAKAQQDSVTQTIAQRGSDERTLAEARTQAEEAKSLLTTEKGKSPGNEQKVSSAESKLGSSEAAVRSDEAKLMQDGNSIVGAQNSQAAGAVKGSQSINSARNAVANAKRTDASTKLRGGQTIAQARTTLASQELSLQSTLATNEVKGAPPKAATVVSALNNVKSTQMTLERARQTLSETKLYAPAEGVVASVKNSGGQTVSGTGTEASSATAGGGSGAGASSSGSGSAASSPGTASSAATSGTGTSGTSGTGRAGASASSAASGGGPSSTNGAGSSAAGSGSGASGKATSTTTGTAGTSPSTTSSTSASSESSSSSFIELVDLRGYQLVLPLSESEVTHVHVGQIATATVEGLEGRKFAAHVVSIAVLSTSNSGVVSYNVTFQLDQVDSALKPGMSATAEIVVNQAEGVNVPTSAISGGSVTVVRNGKDERRRVVTGLAGNSSTIVLSGLKAGEHVALPTSSASSSATNLTSRLGKPGGGLGAGLGGGGGFPAGGGFPGGGALRGAGG
jgi:macrolide-specific efflux system membrane fusion protein